MLSRSSDDTRGRDLPVDADQAQKCASWQARLNGPLWARLDGGDNEDRSATQA